MAVRYVDITHQLDKTYHVVCFHPTVSELKVLFGLFLPRFQLPLPPPPPSPTPSLPSHRLPVSLNSCNPISSAVLCFLSRLTLACTLRSIQ